MAPQCLLLVTFLAFLVGGAISAPPHQSPDTKIVNGTPLDISKVPYQVYLVAGKNMCGGVIVNDRWILTAGHCTYGLHPSQIKVRAGSNLKDEGGAQYAVDTIKIHMKYNHNLVRNDISAIRTSSPISFVGPVGAVKLPAQSKASPPLNTQLRVTGWGRTERGQPSSFLKTANVVVTNFQKCQEKLFDKKPDESVQFCADPVNGVDCGGDSGGPVTMGDTLVGLVSFGATENFTNICIDPTAYVKVSVFRDWIRQITGA